MDANVQAARNVQRNVAQVPGSLVGAPNETMATRGHARQAQVQQLAALGGEIAWKAVEQQRIREETDAAMKVAQGAAMSEFSTDSVMLNKLFGPNASQRGAMKQFVSQQKDEMMINFMEALNKGELDNMDADTFRAYMGSMLSNAMDSIPDDMQADVQGMLLSATQDTMSQMAKAQASKRMEAEQAEYRQNYGNALGRKLDVLHQNQMSPASGVYEQTMSEMRELLTRPEGMDKAAHTQELVTQAISGLNAEVSEVYDLAMEMYGNEFSGQQLATLKAAHEQFLNRAASQGSIREAQSISNLQTLALAPDTTIDTLHNAVAYHQSQYQRNPLSNQAMVGLFNSYAAEDAKRSVERMYSTAAAMGEWSMIPEQDRPKFLQEQVNMLIQNGRVDDAAALWERAPTTLPSFKSIFGTAFNASQVKDVALRMEKEPDVYAKFSEQFSNAKSFYMRDPEKFMKNIGEDSGAVFAALFSYEEGQPLHMAINQLQAGINNPTEVTAEMLKDARSNIPDKTFGVEQTFADKYIPFVGGLDKQAKMQMENEYMREYTKFRKFADDDTAHYMADKVMGGRYIRGKDGGVIRARGVDVLGRLGTGSQDEALRQINVAFKTNDPEKVFWSGAVPSDKTNLMNIRTATYNGRDYIQADAINPTTGQVSTGRIDLSDVPSIMESYDTKTRDARIKKKSDMLNNLVNKRVREQGLLAPAWNLDEAAQSNLHKDRARIEQDILNENPSLLEVIEARNARGSATQFHESLSTQY